MPKPIEPPDQNAAQALESLAERLQRASRWVVLTGSGLSSASGVPTFREAQTGIWAQYDPMELATPDAFARDPKRVWAWYQWRRSLVLRAAPNPGHFALARLEQLKPELTVITQNVDGLHQRAGSRRVLEFHGNIAHDRCSRCDHANEAAAQDLDEPPPCPHCGAPMRPAVVWFGEAIPTAALQASSQAVEQCEIFLSVGTSSLVYPAAGLADVAQRRGALVVEINTAATPFTARADLALQGPATLWLPRIAELLEARLS